MEKYEKCAINNYLHMKGQSVQKIHLDMKEVLENDVLYKQQTTDGQLLYSMVSSRQKMSTFW